MSVQGDVWPRDTQFRPEVHPHASLRDELLKNFLFGICWPQALWTMDSTIMLT